MPEKKRTGGGKYQGLTNPCYFFAVNTLYLNAMHSLLRLPHRNVLIAANEINRPTEGRWTALLEPQFNLFLDSGIFNLSMEHARNHGVNMDTALALAPDEIDGFDELFAKYVTIVQTHEAKLWGYVELDQGGRENKIITRTRLENEYGLKPIPVFHPLNDGWDYLDHLLENYDRICVGNLVKANVALRIKLLYEIERRWRAHPDVWIHALGVSPHLIANTFKPTSCDSSSWAGALRWGQCPALNFERADQSMCDNLQSPMGMETAQYRLTSASLISNYMAYDLARGAHLAELAELHPDA